MNFLTKHLPNLTRMTADFSYGVHVPLRALSLFIRSPRYWRYAAIPIIINLIIYAALGWLLIEYLLPLAGEVVPTPTTDSAWYKYFMDALRYVLQGLAVLTFFVLFLLTFTLLFFAVASPFVDAMSIRIERERYQFHFDDGGYWQMLKDVWMSVKNAIWMTLVSMFWTVLFFPLNFIIPVVGFIPGLLAASYFLGLSFLMFSVEHRRLRRKEYRQLLKNHRLPVLGFGLVVYGALLIPFSGIIVLPIAVIGGTMIFNEKMAKDSNDSKKNLNSDESKEADNSMETT